MKQFFSFSAALTVVWWGQRSFRRGIVCAAALGCAACGENGTEPPDLNPAELELTLTSFPQLDTNLEGEYQAWVIDKDGVVRSAGRFHASGVTDQVVVLESPLSNPSDIMITVEPPGDADDQPSLQRFVGGRVSNGSATLGYNGYLTPGVLLEENPGTHVLFTPSNNGEMSYPSTEDAGIWIFNIEGDSADGSFFITLTPVTEGWTYEGWVVRDFGQADATWLSYGKFRPDSRRKVNTRDNSGLGPFSGQIDYRLAMPQEIYMPGDDWVSNPHDYPVPGGITLPVDLNGCIPTVSDCAEAGQEPGPSRWTHVITIEPRNDENEEPWMARPFVLRPYRNAIGETSWTTPRTIQFIPTQLPQATARVRAR